MDKEDVEYYSFKKKVKGLPQIGRKYLQIILSDKGLVCKVYKEPLQLNHISNLITKWADLNKHLSEEGIQMASKCMKSCSTSPTIRKCES